MKRSTCLSALLIGLSLAVASPALAAPKGKKAKPAHVVKKKAKAPSADESDSEKAKAPPTDAEDSSTPSASPVADDSGQDSPSPPPPSDSPTPPPAAPAGGDPATADPNAQPAQPAITLGTSTAPPGSDTSQTSAEEPKKAPKPRPFAGSAVYISNSMTTNTVFRGQTQYDNPTVESALWLLPRYTINKDFQLRARMIVNYELTNSDDTRYRNEPMLSDTTFNLFYRGLPEIATIKPMISADLGLPTSKLSRARTMVVNPGARLQLVKSVENFATADDWMIIASAIYSHPIYQSRNPEVVDPRPAGAFQCLGGSNCSDLLSGTMNPSDTFAYFIILTAEWGKWNPAIYYLGASQWAYSPTEATNPVDGRPITAPAGFEPTSVRQTHYLSAWLDYNFNSWFTGEVGYWMSRSALGGDGQRGNIVFDRYQDTRVYLLGSFQIDNLVKELQGGNEGEAGVVRAHNTRKSVWNF